MRRTVVGIVCVGWLALVGTGLATLWAYSTTPGVAAAAGPRWPGNTSVARDERRHTLVMFVHPQCECSSASLAELARLMARGEGRIAARVLVYRPGKADPGWERSSLWDAAEAIPGVLVSPDADAEEAERFGAYVSGQTMLYDRQGDLAFSGGMTFARGHEGDNDGRHAILSILDHRTPVTRRTPVFGCFLRETAL